MQRRHRLGDDLRHAQVLHLHHHEQTGLDVLADRDHRDVGLVDAGLPKRAHVRGVDLERVGRQLAHLAHAILVVVHADHVLSQRDQRGRHGRPESAEADDCIETFGHGGCFSLRSATASEAGSELAATR